MEHIELTKKLGRRQRLLLKAMTLGVTNVSHLPTIAPVLGSLVTKGLIAATGDQLSLTPVGVSTVFQHSDKLFTGLPNSADALLAALGEPSTKTKDDSEKPTKANGMKLKSKEVLFLDFISQTARPRNELIRVTQILPNLLERGLVAESDGIISVTEKGSEAFAKAAVPVTEDTAAMFHAADRIEREKKRMERADEFLRLWKDGVTYEEIGSQHGLTRQAVQQIIAQHPDFPTSKSTKKIERIQVAENKKKEAKLGKIQKSLAVKFQQQVDDYWDWEKNVGLNPATISAHSATVEVWWKCLKDHSWKRKPSEIALSWIRSKTSGCPTCAGKTKKPEPQAKLSEAYPDLVSQYWNLERNAAENLSPDEITLGSNRKAWFRCPHDGFEWTASVAATVKQQWSKGNAGCKVCNGTVTRRRGEWSTAPKLIDKFPVQVRNLWMSERNSANGITPEITCGSSKKAWFKCTERGHEWLTTINSVRLAWGRGSSGCPFCAGKRPAQTSPTTAP